MQHIICDQPLLTPTCSLDVLSVPSRNFYEWARNKLLLSLVAGAASMTLLGFCSLTAGESNAANEYKSKSNDDHMEKGYQSIAAGTGTWGSILLHDNLSKNTLYVCLPMQGSPPSCTSAPS